ncbi:unnamed protein product [Rotaria socialis]|uniref:Uncharacterized protein n=1 Tax=Rotaria socialis TaxID=392032 RepID=A0A820CU79_9BILA|nr:unnamed protein product [Rotaria socialis]CAF3598426.1 unnamed protein product [Rotaria socialis]CAF3642862.1 unnamed protein product [Rotaria socialis]CAF3790350.1 unnamed protein product [Rotaria socialis]CAF4220166.1 unnamed protein product [Rotaria socialis]
MFPQYNQRNIAGEIAIWLLITVGALLIPIIVVAICCIRHHLARNPRVQLMDKRFLRTTTMNINQRTDLRSYNGPYVESGNDDRLVLSHSKTPPTFIPTNSIKKQHVHWPNGSKSPSGDDLRSIKDRQFTPRKQPFSGGDTFNTMMLNESPSSHRRLAVIPTPSSALSHLIQTAIMPAGSTITKSSASLLLTPSKQLTPNLAGYHSIV